MPLTTFNFDSQFIDTLDSLKKRTGLTTRTAVLRRAVALLKCIEDNKESETDSLIIPNRSGDRKILIP